MFAGLTKGNSHFTDLILNFYAEMIGFIDEGRVVCIVYLYFRQAFNTVLQKNVLLREADEVSTE